MELLKEKIFKLKKDAENSTLQAEILEHKLSAEKDRFERAEEKVASLSKKIQNTQIELEKTVNEIQGKEKEIEKQKFTCEANEKISDELAEGEMKNTEDEQELKHQIKDLNDFTNIVQMEYEATLKKITAMIKEKTRLEEDEEHLCAQESVLQEKLQDFSAKVKNYKNEAYRKNKQGSPEKRCSLLKQRLQKAELILENTYRKTQQLERTLCMLGKDLQDIKSSQQEADMELQGILSIAHEN